MAIQLKETDKEYYVLVSHQEILDKALELGYDNVSLVRWDELLNMDARILKNKYKCICVAYYYEDEDSAQRKEINKCLEKAGYPAYINTYLFNLRTQLMLEDDVDETEITFEESLKVFPTIKQVESVLVSRGIIPSTDYENRCGNCHELLNPKYKYCIYCGTEKGKGKFEPYFNPAAAVYGGPTKYKFKCPACGHLWISGGFIHPESFFCPECGAKDPQILEEKTYNDFFIDIDDICTEEPFA